MTWNLEDIKRKNHAVDKSDSKAEKFVEIHTKKVQSLKHLVKDYPEPNVVFFIWTLNSFNAFTFIPYVFNISGTIEELVICTYSINRRIIDSLIRFIDKGKIEKVTIFISDSIKYRLPLVYDHLDSLVKNRDNVAVHYAWNHSKIALAKSGENYFVFEGSGNFSENAQFEQYVLLNSKSVYEFRYNCIRNFES